MERLASKGKGKVATTFGAAAARLQGLVSTERDNRALLENGREVAKDVWQQLRSQAGESGAFGDIRATMERIMTRLKEVLKQLQAEKVAADAREAEETARADAAEAEAFARAKAAGVDDASAAAAAAAARKMSGHVTFTTGPDGKLEMRSGEDGEDARLGKLAGAGKSVWDDVRADDKVQKLLKEEIAPGFEALIRASVEVICDLMSTLELPRVDGVYDSPLGSVCYHVDDLAFSEFVVAKDGLHVQNQTGENGEQAGFGSTVSIEGIRTKMNNIRFAYCEYPKSWGVVDSEGLCTVKVDGAKVGISYDIIVNTPELMRIVNHGVELSKNQEKVAELRDKVKERFARRGAEANEENDASADADAATAAPNPEAPRRTSVDSFHSAGSAADALSPKATKSSPAHAEADAALDRAFGGGIFGGGGAEEGEDREEDDEYATETNGSSWGWGVDSFSMFGGGDDAAAALQREATASDAASGAGGSSSAREEKFTAPLTDEQREKLERHRALLRDLLGDEFIIERPVVELRVHATSIAVGQLDVEIGGTSAAWLYNMIALVLTQQLRGTIEERINNLTVRQLGRLSGTVEAYSAGLIKVVVVKDPEEEEEDAEQSMLGSWVSGGGLGKLRRDCGEWGREWQCSHWQPGGVIRRTPSAPGEIMMADGSRELAPAGMMEALAIQEREEDESTDEDEEAYADAAAEETP